MTPPISDLLGEIRYAIEKAPRIGGASIRGGRVVVLIAAETPFEITLPPEIRGRAVRHLSELADLEAERPLQPGEVEHLV